MLNWRGMYIHGLIRAKGRERLGKKSRTEMDAHTLFI